MRITLVSPFDPEPSPAQGRAASAGGVERVLSELSRRMARRGHEVTLVCSTPGAAGRTERGGLTTVRQRRRVTVWGDPVCRLSTLIPPSSEVVHVPATYPFTTGGALRRARRLGVPAVLDFHFEPHPPGAAGRLAASLYRRAGTSAYGGADLCIVRSLAYGRSAATLARVPRERWRVVPNGVDTARFCPDGPRRGDGHLLFVGRLVPYKGVEVLLRALTRLVRPPPLVLAGEGPLRQRLHAEALRLGVEARFCGRVPDSELASLYRGARLTVLPSVNRQEAFGIALLESMACGTPVVASDLPGVAEVARLGGFVASPADPDDLARQVARALDSTRLPRGRPLAAAVERSYSWDAVADRLEGIYREAVEGRRASGNAAPGVMGPARPGRHPFL